MVFVKSTYMHTGRYVWPELSCLTNRTIHQPRKMEQTYLPMLIWILSQSRRHQDRLSRERMIWGDSSKGRRGKRLYSLRGAQSVVYVGQ